MIKLPAGLREKLRIRDGCEVEFFLTVDGDVFFHAITSRAKDWKGAFNTEVRSPPISITEMDAAIAEQVTEDRNRIFGESAPTTEPPCSPAAN